MWYEYVPLNYDYTAANCFGIRYGNFGRNRPRRMKAFYSVFTVESGSLNYQGIAYGSVNASEFLKRKGIPVEHGNVLEMASNPPKRNNSRCIVVRHLVKDHRLITEDLLKTLKMKGQRQAERLLKERKQKRK